MNLATVHANQLSAPIDISHGICRITHSHTHKSTRPRMLSASVRICPSKVKYVYVHQKGPTQDMENFLIPQGLKCTNRSCVKMDEWTCTCIGHLVLRVTPLTSQGALQEECITETFDKSLNGPSEDMRATTHTFVSC